MRNTISLPARQFEDHDDCLSAAAESYIESHPDLAGWELSPRWEDDNREAILLDLPEWHVEQERARRRAGMDELARLSEECGGYGELDE